MKIKKFKKHYKFTKPVEEPNYRMIMLMQGGISITSEPFKWDGKSPLKITVGTSVINKKKRRAT